MENKLKIGLASLVVIAVVVIALNISSPTGNATFTSGANYGPINPSFNIYTKCAYLDINDGWDVTMKTSVSYFDRTTGKTEEVSDACGGTSRSVVEQDCEDGYRKWRNVNCPSGMSCVEGACVPRY